MGHERAQAAAVHRVGRGVDDSQAVPRHQLLQGVERVVREVFVADVVEIHVGQHQRQVAQLNAPDAVGARIAFTSAVKLFGSARS